MKITKRMFLSALLLSSLLFTTNGFADDDDRYEYRNYKKGYDYRKCGSSDYKRYKNCEKGSSKYHKGSKDRFIIGAVFALDLTKDQEAKINKLISEYQDARMKTFDAFKKDGFDKEAFINARMNKKEDMLKARADLIENIYNVLNDKQKEELKDELDDFIKMRKTRGCSGPGCYGRR